MYDFLFFIINVTMNENHLLHAEPWFYAWVLIIALVVNVIIWAFYIDEGKIIPSLKNKPATCFLFGTISFLITLPFIHIFLICLIVTGIAEFIGKLQKEWNI